MTATLDAPAPAPTGPLAVETFNWQQYLARHDPRLLAASPGRVALTRHDPLLFALVYMRHHLASDATGGQVSFSQFHLDLCWWAATTLPRKNLRARESRTCWVAPRGSGKSTWTFGILALWALAHGHRRYIAAFADSAGQAEQHLTSLKRELDTNPLLRRDYPELCAPAVRAGGGVNVSDNRSLMVAESGAVFSAKGIDSSTLGAKVGNQRPDWLMHDDVEPDASNYSAYQKEKRLATLTQAVMPMALTAVWSLVGTTTMPGSIVHDLVRTVQRPDETPAQWVQDEQIAVRNYPALRTHDDGTQTSMWPQMWPLDELLPVAHTASFRLNMQNDPMAFDGEFWTSSDFTYRALPNITNQLLSIDPAVSTHNTSDYTALAVIGYDKTTRTCSVRAAHAVKLAPGAPLRARVLAILDQYPDTAGVVVEVNQGGDMWETVLHDLPVPMRTIKNTAPKEVRATWLLDHYQRGRVVHEQPIPAVEEQMISFPKGTHDDLVDAVGTGVEVFLGKKRRHHVAGQTVGYI